MKPESAPSLTRMHSDGILRAPGMLSLPPPAMAAVCKFLVPENIVKLALVCRRNRQLCLDDIVWKPIINDHFSTSSSSEQLHQEVIHEIAAESESRFATLRRRIRSAGSQENTSPRNGNSIRKTSKTRRGSLTEMASTAGMSLHQIYSQRRIRRKLTLERENSDKSLGMIPPLLWPQLIADICSYLMPSVMYPVAAGLLTVWGMQFIKYGEVAATLITHVILPFTAIYMFLLSLYFVYIQVACSGLMLRSLGPRAAVSPPWLARMEAALGTRLDLQVSYRNIDAFTVISIVWVSSPVAPPIRGRWAWPVALGLVATLVGSTTACIVLAGSTGFLGFIAWVCSLIAILSFAAVAIAWPHLPQGWTKLRRQSTMWSSNFVQWTFSTAAGENIRRDAFVLPKAIGFGVSILVCCIRLYFVTRDAGSQPIDTGDTTSWQVAWFYLSTALMLPIVATRYVLLSIRWVVVWVFSRSLFSLLAASFPSLSWILVVLGFSTIIAVKAQPAAAASQRFGTAAVMTAALTLVYVGFMMVRSFWTSTAADPPELAVLAAPAASNRAMLWRHLIELCQDGGLLFTFPVTMWWRSSIVRDLGGLLAQLMLDAQQVAQFACLVFFVDMLGGTTVLSAIIDTLMSELVIFGCCATIAAGFLLSVRARSDLYMTTCLGALAWAVVSSLWEYWSTALHVTGIAWYVNYPSGYPLAAYLLLLATFAELDTTRPRTDVDPLHLRLGIAWRAVLICSAVRLVLYTPAWGWMLSPVEWLSSPPVWGAMFAAYAGFALLAGSGFVHGTVHYNVANSAEGIRHTSPLIVVDAANRSELLWMGRRPVLFSRLN